jgi:hypothetical protein
MKKMTTVLLGLLGMVTFLIQGKAFAEPAESAVSRTEISAEVSKALETNSDVLSEDAIPVDEELRDEEVIDTDA